MKHAKRLAVPAPEKKPNFGVAQLAGAIAQEMGLPEDEIYCIHLAGVVHDLGEISIAAEILTKPTSLSARDLQMVRTHARVGYDVFNGVKFSWPVAQFVLQHHERVDGSGHPWGLKGPGILLGARILAVADTVEAMSSHRPCRRGFGIDAALEQITQHRGSLYDAGVVDACLKLFRKERFVFET